MQFLELVKKRQSSRKYSEKPVPIEAINRCLEAARLSPSACNSQPWNFIVVRDMELKDKAAREAFAGIYSMNDFAANASLLVVAIREKSTFAARLGGYFRGTQFSLIDLGIACEHFVLQAEEEGLGTCWIGWFNERALKKVLGIPGDKKIDIIISVGYPEDPTPRVKNRKTLEEISELR